MKRLSRLRRARAWQAAANAVETAASEGRFADDGELSEELARYLRQIIVPVLRGHVYDALKGRLLSPAEAAADPECARALGLTPNTGGKPRKPRLRTSKASR